MLEQRVNNVFIHLKLEYKEVMEIKVADALSRRGAKLEIEIDLGIA